MKNANISTAQFEKDSLCILEKLLQGYSKAIKFESWKDREDELKALLSHLPTAPFEERLMNLFDCSYLALGQGIETLIEKSLLIREEMKESQRFVFIKKSYYLLPLLPTNTFLRRFAVYNHDKELCYLLNYSLCFTFDNFLKLTQALLGGKKK